MKLKSPGAGGSVRAGAQHSRGKAGKPRLALGDEKSQVEFLSNRRLKTIYRKLVRTDGEDKFLAIATIAVG
jgi:hypothetical protein